MTSRIHVDYDNMSQSYNPGKHKRTCENYLAHKNDETPLAVLLGNPCRQTCSDGLRC